MVDETRPDDQTGEGAEKPSGPETPGKTGQGPLSPGKTREAARQAADKAMEIAGTATEGLKRFKESPEFKSIGPVTWVGLGVVLLFIVFMLVWSINIRWWIMLPSGAVGLLLLWSQWGAARAERGFEAKVCLAGMIVLIALLIFRDIWISHRLVDIYDRLSESGRAMEELNKMLGR